MGGAIADKFLAAIQEKRAYIPIRIESLRLDTITGFDLYLQVREDEPVVLYAERNIAFTEENRLRLEQNQVEYLLISFEQQEEYRRYIESNLSAVLSDPTITLESKTEILYASAHGLMRELFDKPDMRAGMLRSREIVRSTVDFMHSQRQALQHLIQTAATDYQTYTHSVNGCVLGIALAQRIGYDIRSHLSEFGVGALLRDLGMTRIERSIREHSGKLTVSQYEALKQHPVFSEQIVRGLGETSKVALDLVRHHHEKIDGTGYPDKLHGDEIAPLVRVLTIVDVFDALTTTRSYQPSIGTFDALQLMYNKMQSELDLEFLRAFVGMMGNPGR
ncbi:MAG: HD domain-containing phosphohydrolase [Candidatus Hydrogenedentes bacterium]|nr:HD domain-containing phosphohydrolase [Candidatus Hydrogenedentota bacterium]